MSFAAKACATPVMLRLIASEGFGVDCVSEGELHAALRAGVAPDRLHLHGNNKSDVELVLALERGIHAIVVDNREELMRLTSLVRGRARQAPITLRAALPLEAETHPHLRTSGGRSKFGLSVAGGELEAALNTVRAEPRLRLRGLHAHVGSQLTDAGLYARALAELLPLMELARARLGEERAAHLTEVSVGGGWAVPYRPGDPGLEPASVAAALRPLLNRTPYTLAIEPGRAVVARAGVAVYRVGAVKRPDNGGVQRVTFDVQHRVGRAVGAAGGSQRGASGAEIGSSTPHEFGRQQRLPLQVAVDGGMGDNPRPALYGAQYSALLPERVLEPSDTLCDVVGRYCESGDVLVRDVMLPGPKAGDLLAIPVAGAYHLAMASSYNLVPRPAVVLVESGACALVTRRETVDDVLARELLPR